MEIRTDDEAAAGACHNVRAAITLALWTAAWQAGCSADQLLGALGRIGVRAGVRAASAAAAAVSGAPGPGERSGTLVDLLVPLRGGGPARLLLPVPGDLRGLPVAGEVTAWALDAGAAVVLPQSALALVPVEGQWRIFACDPPGKAVHPALGAAEAVHPALGAAEAVHPALGAAEAVHPALGAAEAVARIDEAVTDAARALAAAEVARPQPDPRGALDRAIAARAVEVPPGMPAAAASLLAKATRVAALLHVARPDRTAAVTGREFRLVGDALAPLESAVREARRTAVAMTAEALTSRSATGLPRR